MNRTVQIYIEGQRLDLFNDERIVVNSSVQDIYDLAKTKTDYSQSFTIPASVNNNKIFKHFYNNEVDNDLDYNLRRSALIEVDLIPFRSGRIKLDGCALKGGQVDNYKITFYGELTSLKDLFGEDKLNSLDVSAYTHIYTGANVQTRVTSDSTDFDLRYPLISSKRVWQYGSGNPSQDIDTTSGHIHYNELFPALRISKIFDAIENKYNVNFTGNFITNRRFTDVFLYLKNRETFDFWTQSQPIDLNAVVSTGISTPETMFDLANNKIVFSSFPFVQGAYSVRLDIISALSTTKYLVDVYENGILINTFEYIGTDNNYVYWVDSDPALYKEVEFKIKANVSCNVSYANIQVQFDDVYGAPTTYNYCSLSTTNLTGEVDLAALMPEMKIEDFFSGVLKQFNLTCVPESSTSYTLLPLETWYALGSNIDVTKYTDNSEITLSTMPLYKKISFEREKSESFMNRKFYDLYTREYGDLSNTFDYDGGEYTIKLPFENLEFNKFTGIPLQVGYCLTKEPDYKSYIPKPILLYKYDKQVVSFHFNNGAATTNVSSYIPFGQDLLVSGKNYSLNFGSDQSTLLNENIGNGIYLQYYSAYLTNLYNKKNRMLNLKLVLPVSILTKLKLNDKLIIRDKRYIINSMQIDITTGVTNIELYNDFRAIGYQPK